MSDFLTVAAAWAVACVLFLVGLAVWALVKLAVRGMFEDRARSDGVKGRGK